MLNKFFCQNCQKVFEAEGTKKVWVDPIYARCWKRTAPCPDCKKPCDEFIKRSSQKRSFDDFVKDLRNRGDDGCMPGGGCCG